MFFIFPMRFLTLNHFEFSAMQHDTEDTLFSLIGELVELVADVESIAVLPVLVIRCSLATTPHSN